MNKLDLNKAWVIRWKKANKGRLEAMVHIIKPS